MTFKELIHLIHIGGYFERLPVFLNDLLKTSVKNPDIISIAEPTLNGYINGDPIDSLANALFDAGFNSELLSSHIESLYLKNHKDSKTYNERLGHMNYREALYKEIIENYPNEFLGISMDNMSDLIAEKFKTIISEAYNEFSLKKARTNLKATNDIDVNVVNSYTLTEDVKSAIKNICRLINNALRTVERITAKISDKRHELANLNDSENDSKWRPHLELSLDSLEKKYVSSYCELEVLCEDIVKLLENKKAIHRSFDKIYSIASGINNDKYKITSSKLFSYAAFSVMVSDYYKNYDLLLRCIDDL